MKNRDFKLGDEVYCLMYGHGFVDSIYQDTEQDDCPVGVMFLGVQGFYTHDGFYSASQNKTLFHADEKPTLVFNNEYPKVMEVSRNGHDWFKRVVFCYNDIIKSYLAYNCFKDINMLDKAINNNESICITGWRHAREIPETITLTKQEIADKFGIDINLLNIIDE